MALRSHLFAPACLWRSHGLDRVKSHELGWKAQRCQEGTAKRVRYVPRNDGFALCHSDEGVFRFLI